MSKKDFDIDVQYLHTTMEKLKEAFAANEDIIANIQLSTMALELLKTNNFESLYDKVKTLTVIYTFIFSIIPKNINPENKKDFKRLLRSGVVDFFKKMLINIYEYDAGFKHEDSAERLNNFIDAQTDFNSNDRKNLPVFPLLIRMMKLMINIGGMLKAKEDMKITRFKTNLLSILKGIRGWDALNFIYWNGNDPLQKMHFIRFVSLKPLKTINLKVTNCSPSRAGGRFEMQCITSPPNSTHPETSQLCL